RPHCPALHRLVLWQPVNKCSFRDLSGHSLRLTDEDVTQVQLVLDQSFKESTLRSYASGLLVFHAFCDSRSVPEDQRTPASPDLIALWISTIIGSYAGGTVNNYTFGVRAWHIIHGVDWRMKEPELDALIWAAEKLQPVHSKRKKHQPYTVAFIEALLNNLNHEDPFDSAVISCLTTAFYSGARLGEFTVPRLEDFRARDHVTRANMRLSVNKNGFEVTVFHIPKTKAEPVNGEDMYWACQNGATNPKSALDNHFQVNNPSRDSHLFAYRHKKNGREILRPHTKPAFLSRLAKAAKSQGLEPLQGHGIRIGSTLEYLLRGLSFEVVKVLGRWKSDAFLVYLRKQTKIMAPYMQAELHEAFLAYTMPPVRCESTAYFSGYPRSLDASLYSFCIGDRS
ncbi:hypothetical protein CPB85DRAFT_1242511, partial [Mucidula mucida]